jgi:hypothetical protein
MRVLTYLLTYLLTPWEYNITTNLREMCRCVEWIHLTQDRDQWQDLVNTVMNLRFP